MIGTRLRFAVMFLALMLLSFTPARAPVASAQQTGTDACQIPAAGSCTETYFLDSGYKYSFSVGVGHANASIAFYIEEPDGTHYDQLTLDGSQTISVSIDTAGTGGPVGCGPPPDGAGCHPGAYVLTFSNASGQNATAQVTWTHYDENQAAVSDIPEFPPQLLAISAVTLLMVAFYALIRGRTSGT